MSTAIPDRVLVISLGGAGDCLMAAPLVRELHAQWPQTPIDVLVMQGTAAHDVMASAPGVRECMLHDFARESAARSLACCLRLRKRRYDLSLTVMPQNRLEYNLITWLIGARRRMGFDYAVRCGAFGRLLLTDVVPEDPQAHLIDNNLRLVTEALGLPLILSPVLALPPGGLAPGNTDRVLRERGLPAAGLIGLHPGSGTTKNLALRRWAPENWARLAQLLAEGGDRTILLFGSRDEQPLRDDIRRLAGLPAGRLQDAPPGSILETGALLQRVSVLVCGDTLLTHLAAAAGTPEVVIMGPTPHTSVYPYGVPHRIVRLGLTCSPCYGYSRHGIRCTHPQPLACLTGITPDLVRQSVDSLLAEVAPETPA